MNKSLSRWLLYFVATHALFVCTHAQQEDVTFFVIGKHANYEQSPSGDLLPVDFSFFSEIFLTTDGDARGAFLRTAGSERIRYRDQRQQRGPEQDNLLLVTGMKRFESYDDLQSWYPDGSYRIDFRTPSGDVEGAELTFPNNSLPKPPRVTLSQGNIRPGDPVDPDFDLDVRWSSFDEGREDPNGILDDLVFVILEDESGRRVSHSGRPFAGAPYLNFADSRHTISASALQPGQDYTLSVEHAILSDTQTFDGVPAMTTYAVTTKLKFRTREYIEAASKQSLSTDAQVVMLYYKDLDTVDDFYGRLLGFEKTLDLEWVKFFETSPNASVGLVAEGEGAWHRAQASNAVMVSIVTSEVDAWYERLLANEDVVFLRHLADGGPVRSFLIQDPGGYTIEFFAWLESDSEQ